MPKNVEKFANNYFLYEIWNRSGVFTKDDKQKMIRGQKNIPFLHHFYTLIKHFVICIVKL